MFTDSWTETEEIFKENVIGILLTKPRIVKRAGSVCPKNICHMTREKIMANIRLICAQTSGSGDEDTAILLVDGTYINIKKKRQI